MIGARCRPVPAERAHEVIAGYTITNDLSVRDWQVRSPTMTMASRSTPTARWGPGSSRQTSSATRTNLALQTYVNGELRQDGSTGEMIYNCFQQVAQLSGAFTLKSGDVIATGTPAGVGALRQPFPEGLLKVGDVVRIEIEGIGELRNTVAEDPDGYLAPETEAKAAWVH